MNIPPVTLSELKCDNCTEYLSCSPVYLKNNGFTLCGKCYISEDQETGNRLTKYEAVAKLLKFPCKYSVYGCTETVPFGTDYLEKPHEIGCEFRNYDCPLGFDCDWKGLRKYIMDHCKIVHPQHVATNPCNMNYDITSFSSKTYVILYGGILFLLHTKICIATGKIFHAVRLLDNPEKISDYKYTLDIKREELIISRPGKIMQQNCEDLNESSAIVTNISSMLDFLDGFSGTIFTIKIFKIARDVPKIIGDLQKCTISPKSSIVVQNDPPKPSTSVEETSRTCRNTYLGCTFKDEKKKCEKHEDFFCSFRNWCWICWAPIEKANEEFWKKHFATNHEPMSQKAIKFNIELTEAIGTSLILMTDIGYVHCRYVFRSSKFKLYIWSPALSKHLNRYKCSLVVSDPATQIIRKVDILPEYNETWDYKFILENNEIASGCKALQLLLKITKK